MPSIKDYNRKLASLRNTSKITKTMKMVSASKLRKAQESQRKARDFAHEVNQLIHRIAGNVDSSMHPLLEQREQTRKVLLVVFTSDKGLCGGFNNNLIRGVERYLAAHAEDGVAYELAFCGRRGHMHFASRAKVFKRFDLVSATPRPLDASKISKTLEEKFLGGEYDKVLLYCNQFISPLSQVPRVQQLLPLETPDLPDEPLENAPPAADIIAEPGMVDLLQFLVPRLVTFKVFYALLENAAGEHGARMTAMDNATSNAKKLISETLLKRNRARQAAITTELIEIISGAEAL